MTPFGHLSVAFVAAVLRGYDRRAVSICLAGAFLPDIVDKPLWRLGVFDTGHTVAHSLLTLVAVGAVVLAVPRFRRAAPALIGYASHVAADLVVAYPSFLGNFLWPVVPQRPTPDGSAVAYWLNYATSAPGAVEITAVTVAAALVLRRGYPPGEPSE